MPLDVVVLCVSLIQGQISRYCYINQSYVTIVTVFYSLSEATGFNYLEEYACDIDCIILSGDNGAQKKKNLQQHAYSSII